jgi:molybdopterin-containing oxidoreductase family iron-sulfur binding subunit
VHYTQGIDSTEPTAAEALRALGEEIAAGRVATLLVLDSNPVYTAPGDLDFGAALAKVPTTIGVSLYEDETAGACKWHVPLAHFLEAWGDVRATDGTISVQQPLIAPLYGGKSVIEILAMLAGDELSSGLEIVQRSLTGVIGAAAADPRLWRKVVHDGVVPGTAAAPSGPRCGRSRRSSMHAASFRG